MSSIFHRFVMLCIYLDTPSEKTGLWQLLIVSTAFKCRVVLKKKTSNTGSGGRVLSFCQPYHSRKKPYGGELFFRVINGTFKISLIKSETDWLSLLIEWNWHLSTRTREWNFHSFTLREWVRVTVVTVVSLRKMLYYNCNSLHQGGIFGHLLL